MPLDQNLATPVRGPVGYEALVAWRRGIPHDDGDRGRLLEVFIALLPQETPERPAAFVHCLTITRARANDHGEVVRAKARLFVEGFQTT